MLYRPFGMTGEMVSILGFGAMRLPIVGGRHDQIDVRRATEMLEYAVDHGVNYVDTAHMYHGASVIAPGNSEPFIGGALAGGLREKVLIATKLPSWAVKSREDMDGVLAAQLRSLRTDRVDCYLLHGIGADTWARFRDLDVLEFLDAAKSDGRIRYAGFSFHDQGAAFRPILDAYDWDFCQIQYNYMDVDFQAGLAGLRLAGERGLGVVVMEPVKGGRLAGRIPQEVSALWDTALVKRGPVEWALRYVWNEEGVALLLSGMSTLEQVAENVRLADEGIAGGLTAEELALIERVRRVYEGRTKVDCTGCNYCMPCPAGISIPLIFSLFNNASLYGDEAGEKLSYRIQTDLGVTRRASACTECGQCAETCPQGIKVPDMLKQAVALLET